LSRGGSTEQAAAELKAAAGDPRVAALALDHLGLLALRASCFSRAAAIYGRVLDIDSAYQGGRGYHLRGLAHFRSGDLSRAQEDAERACALGYEEGCTAADRIRSSARR
jgi:tetratricopeptide (TPR) repeat protein